MASRIVPPVYFLLSILLMVWLHYSIPLARLLAAPWRYSGLVPLLVGLMLIIWSAVLFARAGTPIKPFEECTSLVTGGMYRYTRNPMYLGMVFILIGIALMLGSASPFIPIPLFAWLLQSLFIRQEEVMLEQRFGDEYRAFRGKVRRWI